MIAGSSHKGHVAWSAYFGGYIKCVSYHGDRNWTFQLCDAKGRLGADTSIREAQSAITMFAWYDPQA